MRLRSAHKVEVNDTAQKFGSDIGSNQSHITDSATIVTGVGATKCSGKHGCDPKLQAKTLNGTGDALPLQHIHSSMNDATNHQRFTQHIKPHSKYVIAGLQISSAFVVTLYFVFPTVIRLFPSLIGEIAFLNRVRWPPFVNLSNPEEFGLENTRTFRLDTTEGVNVGAWHVLPSSVQTDGSTETNYESLLSNGAPVILYFHGNAGTRGGWHRVQLYKKFARAGFHVVTLDYRGYGDSSGHPTEDGLCHDSYMMYRWLLDRIGDSPFYIWGHSMGTGVATKVVRRISDGGLRLDYLFLESPFNNIIEAATQHPFSQPFKFLPWFTWGFVEAMKYNKIQFRSDSSIAQVTVPTLILHAQDDGIVPYYLGRKLYETALTTKLEGRVQMVTFDGAHNYGHKHIHKAPELIDIIQAFIRDDDTKLYY